MWWDPIKDSILSAYSRFDSSSFNPRILVRSPISTAAIEGSLALEATSAHEIGEMRKYLGTPWIGRRDELFTPNRSSFYEGMEYDQGSLKNTGVVF